MQRTRLRLCGALASRQSRGLYLGLNDGDLRGEKFL